MKRGMLLGFVLVLASAAPTGAAPETVTLEFGQLHSWGAESSGDTVLISRESDDEITVEVDPVNESCGIDDDLWVGETFTVYVRAGEGASGFNKCEYKLLRILAGAAEFSEDCTGSVAQPPHRCV
ncbi:MAG TPA: hypothetical protein VFA12_03870 [Stellaceae bacterium]|nr:hypothetical protein [Stellaceae bacterium]